MVIKSPTSVVMAMVMVASVVELSSHVDLVVTDLGFHLSVLVLIGSVSHLCISLLDLSFSHVDISKSLPEISMHQLVDSLLLLIDAHISFHVALVHLVNSHVLVHLALINILSPLELEPCTNSVAHVALHAVTLIIALIVALIVAHVAVEVAWIH